jgi:DNA topoisomerase IB
VAPTCSRFAHLINERLKRLIGASFSAKNFRTWNGTLLAAVSLAREGSDADTEQARRRVIARAASDVAQVLGNTPAVARSSYIDPRVFDRYRAGFTIASELAAIDGRLEEEERRAEVELAVLELLASASPPRSESSPTALEQAPRDRPPLASS